MFKKVAKRIYRKGKKFLKKRYVKKGMPNIKRIYKDVKMLKHLLNFEKKRFDVTVTIPFSVGQYNGSLTGAHASIITPYPIEGVAQGQRVGLSIKLVSCVMSLQIYQQANCSNPIRIRWAIVCRPTNDTNPNASGNLASFYEVNPFSNVVDYYSKRDAEYFTQFRTIKSGSVLLKPDNLTNQQNAVQIQVPLKLNHHLKFNQDSTTITTKNQFLLFMTASNGDSQSSAQTGAIFQYNIRWYYTDN